MKKKYIINLIQSKIRSFNFSAKNAKTILGFLKKNFSYIGLSKKKVTFLKANLNSYIKAISYFCFSLLIHIILSLA